MGAIFQSLGRTVTAGVVLLIVLVLILLLFGRGYCLAGLAVAFVAASGHVCFGGVKDLGHARECDRSPVG